MLPRTSIFDYVHRSINTYVIHSAADMHVFKSTDGNQIFPERNFNRKESGIGGEKRV